MDRSRPSPSFRTRRRFPRLEVLGMVEGQLVPLDVPLKVRDLSQGGFSTESTQPFRPGTKHQFRFTTVTHAEVSLDATVVHCRLADGGSGGGITYITGFEFVSTDASDKSVAVLIDTLSSVLALE